MALSEVGAGSQRAVGDNSADSLAVAFPANVGAGRLLIAAGAAFLGGGGPASIIVTDTLGTSYVVLSAVSGDLRVFVAYGVSPSGGANTITMNPSGAATGNFMAIDEFSGQHATPLDVDGGSSTGVAQSAQSDDLTTLTADDLIIGVMSHVSADTAITEGGSYTLIGEQESNANQARSVVFRLVTTAQAYTVNWTTGANVTWIAYTAAFKPAAAEDTTSRAILAMRVPRTV